MQPKCSRSSCHRAGDWLNSFYQSHNTITYSSGKTSTLYRLKLGERQDVVIPTIGFNVETITNRAGVSFTMWDVGGGNRIRPLWKHYASFTSGERITYEYKKVS